MKKLILLMLIFVTLHAAGQSIVSLSFQPVDRAIGLKYDYQINNLGVYASYSKGKYQIDDFIKKHSKLAIGGMYFLENGCLNIGPCYHFIGKDGFREIDHIIYRRVTFEFGSHVILGRVVFGFRFDPLHGESVIDLGFRL